MSDFFAASVIAIEQNLALITAWLVLFQVVLVLYILWLAWNVRNTSAAKALQIAEENEKSVHAMKTKIDNLDDYIRDSFSRDFNSAMKSFDDTTSSVLHQMKDEMLQGIQRIEQIETSVSKKKTLEERVQSGQEEIKRIAQAPDEKLLGEQDSKSDESPGMNA